MLMLDVMPCSVAQRPIEVADFEIRPLPATRAFLLDHLQDNMSKKHHRRTGILGTNNNPESQLLCFSGKS